jgi:hypothetical protein
MIHDPHIDLGHVLIAIAEPHRDGLDAYHRWFERDHMYSAVLIGPGAFAAERYLATRALKTLRYPEDGGVFESLDIGSFVALYFLAEGSVEEHFAWSFSQSEKLGAAGRNNRDRDLVLTWLCDYRGCVARSPESVPPEIALDHRYDGLVMVWAEATPSGSVDELEHWIKQEHLPTVLADSPVDQVLIFAPRDFPAAPRGVSLTPGSVAPNPWSGRGLLLLYFLEASPRGAWERLFAGLGDALRGGGRGRAALVAPFIPTARGTRVHLDELW